MNLQEANPSLISLFFLEASGRKGAGAN